MPGSQVSLPVSIVARIANALNQRERDGTEEEDAEWQAPDPTVGRSFVVQPLPNQQESDNRQDAQPATSHGVRSLTHGN